jgi:hypothetical protein
MKSVLVRSALKLTNRILRPLQMKVMRTWEIPESFQSFIPFADTSAAAEQAGLTIGEYIDKTYNVSGTTQQTIEELRRLGVMGEYVDRICEIGPGSGRYLAMTMQVCQPTHYEVYETAHEWREWLADEYKVIAHETDGASMAATATASMDLVQAYKVFPGLPILTIFRYFREMARVTRPSGAIVFDMLTADCFDAATLEAWLSSRARYPCAMVSRDLAEEIFAREGCRLVSHFVVPMLPGKTETLVFRKDA